MRTQRLGYSLRLRTTWRGRSTRWQVNHDGGQDIDCWASLMKRSREVISVVFTKKSRVLLFTAGLGILLAFALWGGLSAEEKAPLPTVSQPATGSCCSRPDKGAGIVPVASQQVGKPAVGPPCGCGQKSPVTFKPGSACGVKSGSTAGPPASCCGEVSELSSSQPAYVVAKVNPTGSIIILTDEQMKQLKGGHCTCGECSSASCSGCSIYSCYSDGCASSDCYCSDWCSNEGSQECSGPGLDFCGASNCPCTPWCSLTGSTPCPSGKSDCTCGVGCYCPDYCPIAGAACSGPTSVCCGGSGCTCAARCSLTGTNPCPSGATSCSCAGSGCACSAYCPSTGSNPCPSGSSSCSCGGSGCSCSAYCPQGSPQCGGSPHGCHCLGGDCPCPGHCGYPAPDNCLIYGLPCPGSGCNNGITGTECNKTGCPCTNKCKDASSQCSSWKTACACLSGGALCGPDRCSDYCSALTNCPTCSGTACDCDCGGANCPGLPACNACFIRECTGTYGCGGTGCTGNCNSPNFEYSCSPFCCNGTHTCSANTTCCGGCSDRNPGAYVGCGCPGWGCAEPHCLACADCPCSSTTSKCTCTYEQKCHGVPCKWCTNLGSGCSTDLTCCNIHW